MRDEKGRSKYGNTPHYNRGEGFACMQVEGSKWQVASFQVRVSMLHSLVPQTI